MLRQNFSFILQSQARVAGFPPRTKINLLKAVVGEMGPPVLGWEWYLGGAGHQHWRQVSGRGAVDAKQLCVCACKHTEEKVVDSPLFWNGTWTEWWCKKVLGKGGGVALK